jgi:hypothetical protein
MFLLNNKSRVLKYKNDVLTVNPQMIEKVAEYAGCTVEEVIKAMDNIFLTNHQNKKPLFRI